MSTGVMSWESSCTYYSKTERKLCPYYKHWIPDDVTSLSPLPVTEENLMNFYEEFDTLIHVTSLENANSIIKDGFRPRPVVDNSVVNTKHALLDVEKNEIDPRPSHPASLSNVLWYGPATNEQIMSKDYRAIRYGNIIFSMKTLFGYEGIRRYDSDFKYYFIEVIEYKNSSACRILVSRKRYPLKEYDPFQLGGPLVLRRDDCGFIKFFHLKKVKRDGTEGIDNVLEIMREESTDRWEKSWWSENHHVSFSYCHAPRQGVEAIKAVYVDNDEELLKNILKLAFIFLADNQKSYTIRFTIRTQFTEKRWKDVFTKVRKDLDFLATGDLPELSIEDRILQGLNGSLGSLASIISTKKNLFDGYRELLQTFPSSSRQNLSDITLNKIEKYFENTGCFLKSEGD